MLELSRKSSRRRGARTSRLSSPWTSSAKSTLLEQAGRKIIHMEVGEPSAPPPRLVREAAIAALGGQPVGYTDALGLFSLRQRIASHYAETYGVSVDPQRVAITTGSSGGFVMAFLALFDAGARVAVSAPGYPAYRNIFKALGVETVEVKSMRATVSR